MFAKNITSDSENSETDDEDDEMDSDDCFEDKNPTKKQKIQ